MSKKTAKVDLRIPNDLSIKPVAMSILALIAGSEWDLRVPEFSTEVATYAWYNCRERGISLVVRRQDKDRLVLVFGEQRNSDSIFLDKWKDKSSWTSPPTTDDFTEEAYGKRRYFGYGECGKAAIAIIDDIRSYLDIKE